MRWGKIDVEQESQEDSIIEIVSVNPCYNLYSEPFVMERCLFIWKLHEELINSGEGSMGLCGLIHSILHR